MKSFVGRSAKIVALFALAAYVLLKGVLPALSGIANDFPGYYTAARLVAEGSSVDRLYDDVWFQQQIRRYGLESAKNPGKFAPFPPPTALLLVPLASLPPLQALRVVVAVGVLCLIAAALLLARMLAWDPLDAALLVLCSGVGILTCLQFGQPYIVISTFCILGYYLYLTGRPWLAGMALGVFVPVKYYPVVILGCLAWRREWKVVLGGTMAIVAVAALSIGVLGWRIHQIFLASVLGNHLIGHLSLREHSLPYTAVYQSFDTLFNRLFMFDATWNPQPFRVAPLLRTGCLVITKVALVLAAVVALAQLARRGTAGIAAPAVGILGILVLLIAPATATYMCVLLWLPVALLSNHFLSQGARLPAYLILGIYALIGFIPYGHAYRFEGRGGLTVLAYPRLFLLLAMFLAAIGFLVRTRPQGERRAGPIV